jgi:methylenetetrahydrofolate reductase (NADPH)
VLVRELGFEPIVHLSARRIESEEQLDWYLGEITSKAQVKRVFIIAGDPPEPEGPYSTSLQIIETGLLQKHGIQIVGVGGHPEGHPNNTPAELWDWMERKIAAIRAGGMIPLVVTQFAFDDDAIVAWVKEMRARGIDVPVRLGVPGPAGIKRPARLRQALRRRRLGQRDEEVRRLADQPHRQRRARQAGQLARQEAQRREHGRVRLHFYPFGALTASAEWINQYDAKHATWRRSSTGARSRASWTRRPRPRSTRWSPPASRARASRSSSSARRAQARSTSAARSRAARRSASARSSTACRPRPRRTRCSR